MEEKCENFHRKLRLTKWVDRGGSWNLCESTQNIKYDQMKVHLDTCHPVRVSYRPI